ncbi:hypothetical protein HanXRQr2_Chr03g0119871 [Helianthus annuus]|uniref:Uncharacterized protein n=1 Tax=Helianthus annuus TaxID=4232 RepID=A0A9K3NVU2_HELAN|nr:hypothetical protein HanXRQr2_Chr03g0119871 [Helianthus annuus]
MILMRKDYPERQSHTEHGYQYELKVLVNLRQCTNSSSFITGKRFCTKSTYALTPLGSIVPPSGKYIFSRSFLSQCWFEFLARTELGQMGRAHCKLPKVPAAASFFSASFVYNLNRPLMSAICTTNYTLFVLSPRHDTKR